MKKLLIKFIIVAVFCLSITTLLTPERAKANYGSVYWGYLYITNAAEHEVWASLGWTCGCSQCGGCYNRSISIDWGDGTPWKGIAQASSAYHKYEKEGIYNVRARMEYSCQRDQAMICFEDQTYTVYSEIKQAVLVPPGPFDITETEAQCDSNNLPQNYLQWSQSENARGYFVYRNIKSSQFSHSFESNYIGYTENTNFLDKDILSNTEYKYSVQAVNDYANVWSTNGGQNQQDLENGLPIQTATCSGPTFALNIQPLTITAVKGVISDHYDYDVTLTPNNGFNKTVSLAGESSKYCKGFGAGQTCMPPFNIKFLNSTGQEISNINVPNKTIHVTMRITGIESAIPTSAFDPAYANDQVLTWNLKTEAVSDIKRSQIVYFKLLPHPILINGDIYSGKNIENLSLTSGSVASANGVINVSGTNYKIGSYSNNDWQRIITIVTQTKDRLQNERSTALNGFNTITNNTWVLDSTDNNYPWGESSNNYPDGRVWFVNGDLTLGEFPNLFQPLGTTTFQGKGTIIVNGNVNIRNNIQYSSAINSSLGIIATGDINIEQANNLVGYYFTPGTVNIDRGANRNLNYNVNITAGNIIFSGNSQLTINPDKNSNNPPPGFQKLIMPTYSEVSP